MDQTNQISTRQANSAYDVPTDIAHDSGVPPTFIHQFTSSTDKFSPEISREPRTESIPQSDNHDDVEDVEVFEPSWLNSSNELSRIHAILIRYFVQELATWFDICDPARHFGVVVPVQARESKALLNAIYTASARHLVRLPKHRNQFGALEWQGHLLAGLTTETAVHFQNTCIRELLGQSHDPQEMSHEDLLAATIILRTDEEMDAPLHDEEFDRQIFLKVTSAFIKTQVTTYGSPQASVSSHRIISGEGDTNMLSPNSQNTQFTHSSPVMDEARAFQRMGIDTVALGTIRTDGLRQACFWVAFRQELHASLMQQRQLYISLSPYRDFCTTSPTDDPTWTHRLAVLCAEVVEHCYGSADSKAQSLGESRWEELKQKEKDLSASLPQSFNPIFNHEPQLVDEQVFPEIWYLNPWHATGAAYIELTKILLHTFDSKSTPLGPGYLQWLRKLGNILRSITKKLCGIALSNKRAPPLFLNACSAIVMCGEQFEIYREQEAILQFLATTERDIGFPTKHLISRLEKAWVS